MAVHGQILDGEGPLGQETHHLQLQGARSGGGGGDPYVARFEDARDQFGAVQVHESAKTVENGRVRQWSNQRLHEHWPIPPVSVEVAVRRVGWLQAMLRDEKNHAQPPAAIFCRFLGKAVLEEKGTLCEGANPFAVAFHRDVYFQGGVTGTRELYEALWKDGFQSLFVAQSEAREALLRIDTFLLRAACWTLGRGSRAM